MLTLISMKNSMIFCWILFSVATCFGQKDSSVTLRKGGFYNRNTIGVLAGTESGLSFQLSNGYRFNNQLEVGFGFGYEKHYYYGYAPIFLESRYHFGKGNTQPFIGIMGGYMAVLNQQSAQGEGYTAGGSIGVTHFFTPHFGVSTSLGYRYLYLNRSDNYYIWNGNGMTVIQELNRFEIRIGIVFR